MITDPAVYMQCPYCRESVILEYDRNTPTREPHPLFYRVRCHKGRAKCRYSTAYHLYPSAAWEEHEDHMIQLHDYHEEPKQ